jgi:hypothetical protein
MNTNKAKRSKTQDFDGSPPPQYMQQLHDVENPSLASTMSN